jgi:colicin import membrane protein
VALKFDRSEPGFWVSSVAHIALLAAGIFAAASQTFPEAQEGIPVEVVTDNQLSEMMRGEKTAKAQPQPKPRVDRVAEKVEERDPGEAPKDAPAPPRRPAEVKVDEQPVEVAAAPPPTPTPPLRPVLDQPEPPPRAVPARPEPAKTPEPPKRQELAKLIEREEAEAQAEAKAEAKARADAQAKAVADAKAKAEADAKAQAEADAKARAKAEADAKAKAVADAKAKAEAKARMEAKAKADAEAKAQKQAELADKFSAGDIRQLLASKEPSQSSGSTGREVNRTAALGTTTVTAQKLSPSLRDALVGLLQSQIERCYAAPPGAASASAVMPVLNIQFNADGTLGAEPRVVKAGPTPADRSIAEAAMRAVRRCAPYRVPAQFAPYYSDWKNITAQFELPQA